MSNVRKPHLRRLIPGVWQCEREKCFLGVRYVCLSYGVDFDTAYRVAFCELELATEQELLDSSSFRNWWNYR